MIQITKSEAMWLAEQGYPWKDVLHHTYTKHKKYYITERPDVVRKLEQRRKQSIVGGRQ